MKALKYPLFAIVILAMAFSCRKAPKLPEIVGTWELTEIQYTKVAEIDGKSIDVTVSFSADGDFSMSQILGDGRAREYAGTWTLADDILCGTYSDGTPWGASYRILFKEDTMTMAPIEELCPEIYVYTRVK